MINGIKIPMELDTGAAVSVMCETECLKHFPDASFRETDVGLVTYKGTSVTVKGIMDVDVKYQSQHVRLPLVIAKDSTGARMPTLLGREWLTEIKLHWPNVVRVQNVREKKQLTDKYREVFQPGYGAIKGFHASIVLKIGATPVFCKARPVPYALREQVEQELLNMEKAGIVYRVRHSAWATPLVVVPKKKITGFDCAGITGSPSIFSWKLTIALYRCLKIFSPRCKVELCFLFLTCVRRICNWN